MFKFKKKELISAFDIEDNIVKLAQIAIDKTPRLNRLVTLKAQSNTTKDLVKAIRSLATDYKVAGTYVIVNLPRYRVTVKNLKLPSINPVEIEKMIALQATKHLPFSLDKIISGYKILGMDEGGYSDVMIALAHRDIIDNLLKLFNQAGVNVEKLSLSSESISLWYAQRQKEDEKGSYVCLVDIGKSALEIQIIREGRFYFTRSISFSPSGDMEERIVDEIRKSLFTYQKTSSGAEVTKLVLTGRHSIVKREAPALKKSLNIPMVYIDILRQCPKVKDASLPQERDIFEETFTAVLSLGFNYDKAEMNLMPQDIRLKRISKLAKRNLAMSAALFLSISLGLGGIVTKRFIDKKRYLASIDRRLNETKPKVEKLSKLKEITHVIKRQLEITGSSIDIIRELYTKIPKEISFTVFDYEDGRSCLLRGTSKGLSDVFKFISTLEDSIYFENVKVRYATKRVIGKKELTDFEIICQLTRINAN